MMHQKISTVDLKGFALVGTHSPVVSAENRSQGGCSKVSIDALGDDEVRLLLLHCLHMSSARHALTTPLFCSVPSCSCLQSRVLYILSPSASAPKPSLFTIVQKPTKERRHGMAQAQCSAAACNIIKQLTTVLYRKEIHYWESWIAMIT